MVEASEEASMAVANEEPGTTGALPPERKLRRSRKERVLAGVCGGLGTYFGIDPILFRIAFVVLTIAGSGAGIPLYIIALVIMPEGESTPPAEGSASKNSAALLVGTIFIALGLGLLADMLVPWFDRLLWPSLLVGLGIYVIVGARRGGAE